MRTDVCTLISESYEQNELGEFIPTETRREIICQVGSITRTEFFDAGRAGLSPEKTLSVFWLDYNGEAVVEFHGQRYGVYRTYTPDEENIELYLEKKAGA